MRDGGADGQTDGRSETNKPPNNFGVTMYNKLFVSPGYKHCGYLSDKTDHMACVAAKWVPMNLVHPAHYSKSVCKHL